MNGALERDDVDRHCLLLVRNSRDQLWHPRCHPCHFARDRSLILTSFWLRAAPAGKHGGLLLLQFHTAMRGLRPKLLWRWRLPRDCDSRWSMVQAGRTSACAGGIKKRARVVKREPVILVEQAMSDRPSENRNGADTSGNSGRTSSWRGHAPYLLVLALALAGVAYSNMSQKPLAGYWELLALITGGVCIFTEWAKIDDKRARIRLAWTVSHGIAVLVAMNIMLLAGVQQLLPAPATSLVLLILLALGSFLGWGQSCFVGTVFSWAGSGSGRSGRLMGKTIRALRHSRRCLGARDWYRLLVEQKGKLTGFVRNGFRSPQ